MISGAEWSELRRLHYDDGLPIKVIARKTGRARNTVRAALRSDQPPVYVRTRRTTPTALSSSPDPLAAEDPTASGVRTPLHPALSEMSR